MALKQQKRQTLPRKYSVGILQDLDFRYSKAKLVKQNFELLVASLGRIEHLSHQQLQLAEKASFLTAHLAKFEKAIVLDEPYDETAYLYCLNSYQGLMGKLGLKDIKENPGEAPPTSLVELFSETDQKD